MAPTRPLSLKKSNGLELPNADVLSFFRHTTCSASASAHYNTLKHCKIYTYSDCRKIEKTPIVHHLLSSSVQTAYRETGDSNRSISFTKIIYTGACTILDTQNLHTFSQSRHKLQVWKLRSVSFGRHFLVCSREVTYVWFVPSKVELPRSSVGRAFA